MKLKTLKTSAVITSGLPSGRYDSETALPAEVTVNKDSFRITVKDDNGVEVYKNDEEAFEYHSVPSLSVALQYYGAELTEDKIQFLEEALKGDAEKVGKAVLKLVEVINGELKDSAKNNAYQRGFNAKKPLTEENKENATASIVRNFMKLNNVSDETAITTLKGYGVIAKDFSLDDFRGNRGKR